MRDQKKPLASIGVENPNEAKAESLNGAKPAGLSGAKAKPSSDPLARAIARLSEPSFVAELQKALPRCGLTPERLLRIYITEIRRNPRLGQCTTTSLAACIMQSAQVGLELGGTLGHAWAVPFWNSKTNQYEATFIIGYTGVLELAWRAGYLDHVSVDAYYANDHFKIVRGTEEHLEHIPASGDRGNLLGVYAVVFPKQGRPLFKCMTMEEVESYRLRSKSPDSGPWQTDKLAMAYKCVFLRMRRWLPSAMLPPEGWQHIENEEQQFLQIEPTMTPTEHTAQKLEERLTSTQHLAPIPAPVLAAMPESTRPSTLTVTPTPEPEPESAPPPALTIAPTSEPKPAPSPSRPKLLTQIYELRRAIGEPEYLRMRMAYTATGDLANLDPAALNLFINALAARASAMETRAETESPQPY
jgi:phage RecT family recombinase